ncbi:MAG: c-type cytochrome domain-containing protein [Bacteroidota bacterium]
MKTYKIYFSLALLIILTTISWITSCTHDARIADMPEVCFEGDVLPIFTNSCAISGCHDGQGESGLVLNNYLDISHSVVPGNPYSSKVYKAIIATRGENKMPPDQPLSLENRTIIRLWIEQGAGLTVCHEITATGGGDGGSSYINPRACFTRDILPVLVSRCATTGCHDAISHKEGYIFASYTTSMTAVRAGNPGNSKLYQVIKFSSGEEKMPPAGKSQLSVAEIDSIGKWIGYGALNENCGEVCDTINPVTFSGNIWPVMQTSCTGCHSGTSLGGGIALANYSNVKAAATNGSLMNSLRGTGVLKMPMGGSFSACRIRQFEIWVNNGSLNN